MAPEENAGSELLLQSFERRFLAARALRSFPWQVGGGAERPAGLAGVQGQTGWVSVLKLPAFLPRECLGSRRSGPRDRPGPRPWGLARVARTPPAPRAGGGSWSLEAKLRDSSDSELLGDILQKTVKHPVCVKHPLSVKYARCFLSELIKKHAAVHTEPLDELYEALAETLMAKESTQGHQSYLLPSEARSHSPRAQPSSPMAPWAWSHGMLPSTLQNGPSRTRQPSLTGDLGAQGRAPRQAYPGAVTDTAPFPPARTILELDSGAGLTGLAMCKLCRSRAYIFSDCHSWVLKQLRGNALLNGLSLEADITANLALG
ncbi:protein-lysine N-methyltransferase EEF2KMT-like [Symphalangus syndactylus]|uniref:protein-lysine N-methyltransferase EEF2KMT-like n=1 Tax=Symphalangus syndactylus TaxID=9590 RepID=UPI0030060A0B